MSFKRFEVVRVPFPFTDKSASKKRQQKTPGTGGIGRICF